MADDGTAALKAEAAALKFENASLRAKLEASDKELAYLRGEVARHGDSEKVSLATLKRATDAEAKARDAEARALAAEGREAAEKLANDVLRKRAEDAERTANAVLNRPVPSRPAIPRR